MFAVFESGGQQHKVAVGETLKLEKLENGIGDNIKFDKVLLLNDDKTTKVGAPYVKDAVVSAEVVEQGRHKKVNIIKFKRRKHSLKRQGHRQYYTAVKIIDMKVVKKAAPKAAPKKAEDK